MQTYTVTRDLHQNGRIYRKGARIEMSDKQARHLRLGGFVEPTKPAKNSKPDTKQPAKLEDKAKA